MDSESLGFSADTLSGRTAIWEQVLGHFKGLPNLHFLEIGSLEGQSACWLLQNILTHETCTITCVDLFTESFGPVTGFLSTQINPALHFNRNIHTLGAEHKVIAIKGRSQQMLRGLPLDAYDFVYADGSHHPADILTDAVLAWDCLKIGGIMCFDDYLFHLVYPQHGNPQIAIDAFLRVFEGHYDLLHKAAQVIVRKTRAFDAS